MCETVKAGVRRLRILRLAALSVMLTGPMALWPSAASASCAAPSVDVDPSSVAAGGVVEVRGTGFGDACNDTGGPGPVLGGAQDGIEVRLVDTDVSTVLAQVDADCDYAFAVRVQIPREAAPGSAVLTISDSGGTYEERLQITSAPPAARPAVPPTIVDAATSGPGCGRSGVWTRWAGAAAAAGAVAVVFLRRRRPGPSAF